MQCAVIIIATTVAVLIKEKVNKQTQYDHRKELPVVHLQVAAKQFHQHCNA